MFKLKQTDVVGNSVAVVVGVLHNPLDSNILLVSIVSIQFVVSNSYSQTAGTLPLEKYALILQHFIINILINY